MNRFNDFKMYSTSPVLEKDWIFPYGYVKKDSKILLYGAGLVGQAYYEQIKQTNYCKLVAWVDKEHEMYREWGMDVSSIDIGLQSKYDLIVLAVSELRTAKDMTHYLEEHGVNADKIIWGYSRVQRVKMDRFEHFVLNPIEKEIDIVLEYRNISRESKDGLKYKLDVLGLAGNKNKIILPRVVLELTNKCTLNCKNCNNLMQYYSHKEHVGIEGIKNDINQLFSLCDRVITIELIGGEPLCYPELIELIKYVKTVPGFDVLELTTNGTIVPTDELLKELNDEKIVVRISKYPGSRKIECLVKKLDEYEINYRILDELRWIDSGKPENKGKTVEEITNDYIKCESARFCKTLYKGKLFCCARAASLYDLKKCEDKINYIDIYEGNAKEKLREFIVATYMTACNYCTNTDEWRVVTAGE